MPDSAPPRDLPAVAIRQIEQAVDQIDAAQAALSTVRGDGYCQVYEELGSLSAQVYRLASRLRSLPRPTGHFTAAN